MDRIRAAVLPADEAAIRALWLDYLRWGNDELEAHYGFRLTADETVERDLAEIAKFLPPNGHMLLATEGDEAVGIGCLRRIGPDTAEIKRMFVQPGHRGRGLGRALLDRLIACAEADGFGRLRLDSAAFMTAAHHLYRSRGFVDIEPYPESEIPPTVRDHWVFMERRPAAGAD
jgi:GNAT superfamily N-acetyltransferase